MLCLSDSIRDNDPSVQRLLSAVEEARTLTALILAAWLFTRGLVIHIVEAVLAERARCPSSWPRCPRCGVPLQSKGFATRQVTSLFGPIQWGPTEGNVWYDSVSSSDLSYNPLQLHAPLDGFP